MKIKDIKPYARNARDNTKSIPAIAESIKNFGFVGQIVLRSQDDPTIVAGHHRVEAVKSLGWTEIPDENICYCDNLTDEEIKALRLADNRTHEGGKWNVGLLKSEVKNLEKFNFDMSKFNFNFDSKNKEYGEARLNTDNAYHIQLVNRHDCYGAYELPLLEKCDYVPEDLLPFNCAKTASNYDVGIHFFIDDYQFERVWNSPEKYIPLLSKFECVLTPDFSLYLDMPLPLQLYNVYRSRALGVYWQSKGIKVIPTLQWSDEKSYDFCFDYMPEGGTFAVSTVGVLKDKKATELFIKGIKEVLKRIDIHTLILYGSPVEGFDFGDIKVVNIESNVFKREA